MKLLVELPPHRLARLIAPVRRPRRLAPIAAEFMPGRRIDHRIHQHHFIPARLDLRLIGAATAAPMPIAAESTPKATLPTW